VGFALPKPAAAVESSACGRGIVVGLTSILDQRQCFLFFYQILVNEHFLHPVL